MSNGLYSGGHATCVLCDDDGLDESGRLCAVCGELEELLVDLEQAREAGLDDRVLRLEAAVEGLRGPEALDDMLTLEDEYGPGFEPEWNGSDRLRKVVGS